MTKKRRSLRKQRKNDTRNNFLELAETIVYHPEYSKMKDLEHHSASVYAHSINVAYHSYRIASRLGFDGVSTARGGLLHDFYLYEFSKKRTSSFILVDAIKHTINHPKKALENAEQHFTLNKVEKNIISAHMFPVGLPKSPEAFIVSMVDKGLAIYEYGLNFSKALKARYEMRFSFASIK